MRMKQFIKLCTVCLLFTLVLSSAVYAQERTVHVVEPGESLYGISVQYNVTIEEIETWNDIAGGVIHPGDELFVSPPNGGQSDSVESEVDDEESAETDDESDTSSDSNYIPTIVQNTYPPETHVHLHNILNQFRDFPMLAEVQILQEDSESARINLEKDFDNSPLGRVSILAYTLNKVERGGHTWDEEFQYTDEIEALKTTYPINITESGESSFTSGSFSLTELVAGTLNNDENAFYLLLHYIGFADSADLNTFVSNTTGNQFSLNISIREIHEFLNYIYNHNDQTIIEIWQSQDSAESIIGTDDDTMLQLFAENDDAQYVTGIISGETNYVVTVIIEHLETHDVDGIASRIHNNHDIEADQNSYASHEESQYVLRYTLHEMSDDEAVLLENF